MKLSKVFHVISVIIGLSGVATALTAVRAGTESLVWGLTREHLLFCAGLLFLAAIWVQISTIHHMMLEEKGEII
jgi:hypothetical protein